MRKRTVVFLILGVVVVIVALLALDAFSRKMLKGKASLDLLRQMYETRLPVEGKVTGRNKGGFDVNISGIRAFCPLSQITLGKIENPDVFVGETYEFRVTEMSDDNRRVVVSRAALMASVTSVGAGV